MSFNYLFSSKSAASIQEVNSMNKDQYMEHFRNVLELWPPANDAVMALRPFQDKIAMMDAYKDYIGNLTNDRKLRKYLIFEVVNISNLNIL